MCFTCAIHRALTAIEVGFCSFQNDTNTEVSYYFLRILTERSLVPSFFWSKLSVSEFQTRLLFQNFESLLYRVVPIGDYVECQEHY